MLLYGGKLKAVNAVGRKVVKRPYPSPDEVIANLEFANGALGCFHYSSMAYAGELSYLIHAENYTLTVTTGNHLEIRRRPELRSLREDGSKDCRPLYHANIAPETRQFPSGTVDHLIMLDFLDSVRTGAPIKASIRAGYEVAELAEAIERSWREQRKIELPLTF
jgi:predicted dehydrogenase